MKRICTILLFCLAIAHAEPVVRLWNGDAPGAKGNNPFDIPTLTVFLPKNATAPTPAVVVCPGGAYSGLAFAHEGTSYANYLNEQGISLHIKNYNLNTLTEDGRVNPVASLICTILLEIASMERLTIRERMASGRDQYIAKCRRDGVKMGRPATYRKSDDAYKDQYQKEISLLRKGISLRNITAITGTSVNTLRKLKAMF